MKVKDIEIGKSYTDKKNNSIRKVVFIEGNKLRYKLIMGRYKSNIGKESYWDADRFAKWANNVCDEVNKINIEDFLKYPKEGILFKLKDEYLLEDFFKLDGIDYDDIKDFNMVGFKYVEVGEYSSPEVDEYDLRIRDIKGNICSFPCSGEEIKKFFEIL